MSDDHSEMQNSCKRAKNAKTVHLVSSKRIDNQISVSLRVQVNRVPASQSLICRLFPVLLLPVDEPLDCYTSN